MSKKDVGTRYPDPPDPVFDVEDSITALRTFQEGTSELVDGVTSLLTMMADTWDGDSADAAESSLRGFRSCLDDAWTDMETAAVALGSYRDVLVTVRGSTASIREDFAEHWPEGLGGPCAGGEDCEECDSILDGLDTRYATAWETASEGATTCNDVLAGCHPEREGLLVTSASPLGPLPDGGFMGWGRDGELRDYAERLMGLSPEDLARWLDHHGPEDLAALAAVLDDEARQRLITYLLTTAPALLLPKVLAGVPEAVPHPGDGVGWELPGAPLYPEDVEGHDWLQDINQRGYGDCWYLATLAGIVQRDPGWVQENVVMNDNGTVTVYLYDDDGNRIPVTVTAEVPSSSGDGAHGVWGGRGGLDSGYSWPAYVEKAMAQFYGDGDGPQGAYAGIEGDSPSEAVQALTGQDGETTGSADDVAEALENGQAVTATTPSGDVELPDGRGTIVGSHVYTVVAREDGLFELRNPWGSSHPEPLTAEEMEEYFSEFTIVPST